MVGGSGWGEGGWKCKHSEESIDTRNVWAAKKDSDTREEKLEYKLDQKHANQNKIHEKIRLRINTIKEKIQKKYKKKLFESTEAQGPPRSVYHWLGDCDPTFLIADEAAIGFSYKRDSRGSKFGVVPMTPCGTPDQARRIKVDTRASSARTFN